jgi:hypothetical protein
VRETSPAHHAPHRRAQRRNRPDEIGGRQEEVHDVEAFTLDQDRQVT